MWFCILLPYKYFFLNLEGPLWGKKPGRNGFGSQSLKDMEETRNDAGAGPTEQGPPSAPWWPSDFIEKMGSVSLGSQEETLNNKSHRNFEQDALSSQRASQILWSTGVLSEPIPNGFYSVIPVRITFYLVDFCFSDVIASAGT